MNSSKVHNQLNKWKCIDFRLLFFQFSRFERTNSRFLVLIFIFVITYLLFPHHKCFVYRRVFIHGQRVSQGCAVLCRGYGAYVCYEWAPFPSDTFQTKYVRQSCLVHTHLPVWMCTSLDSQLILCYSHSIIADLTIDLCMKIIRDERW